MIKNIKNHRLVTSFPAWTVLRAFLAGLILGPFLFALANGPDDFRPNFITEAMGIGFTVLVIDWIYEQRSRRELRRRLVREAGSRSNDIAVSAVETLRDKYALTDDNGVLKGADLCLASLQKARLDSVNLQGSLLIQADLREAILQHADLRCANMYQADLREAKLGHADLSGADLLGAKLEGAELYGVTLPDGNRYSEETGPDALHAYTSTRIEVRRMTLPRVNIRRRELGYSEIPVS